MAEYELKAEIRSDQGKAATRRLRRQAGCVPAILYGAGKEPQSLSISHNDLHKACENEAFFSHIIKIHSDGKVEDAILKDLQRHPAKDSIMNEDFSDENGGFFIGSKDAEKLMVRAKDSYDSAIPSGNSVAVMNLFRLSKMTGDKKWTDLADNTLKAFTEQAKQAPTGSVSYTHLTLPTKA